MSVVVVTIGIFGLIAGLSGSAIGSNDVAAGNIMAAILFLIRFI